MGIADPSNLIELASSRNRSADALCRDLMGVIFPFGETLPSDRLQTEVKVQLQRLIAELEVVLQGAEEAPSKTGERWELLAQSGLLREKGLIDFALARIAEENLQKRLSHMGALSPLQQFPAALLSGENQLLAELAKALLRSEQVARPLHHRLEPKMLHLLCWRLVAAMQSAAGNFDQGVSDRAQKLLKDYDDVDNPALVARKITFFLEPGLRSQLLDPRFAGLHLFAAGLATEFDLPHDQVLRMIHEGSGELVALFLRACEVPVETATPILGVLGSVVPTEQYQQVTTAEARSAISSWRPIGHGDAADLA